MLVPTIALSLAPLADLDGGPAADGVGFAVPVEFDQVLVSTDIDDRFWMRNRDVRASFDGDGVTVYPAFGSRSPREWPLRLDLSSVRSGAVELELAEPDRTRADAERVVLDRGPVREIVHLAVDSIEQTFVLDALPSLETLTVTIDVETDLAPIVDGDTLRFEHLEFGGLEYGHAFAVDATGRRAAIPRIWAGGSIELTIPADFLAEAELPLTIDPPISAFFNSFGMPDDLNPDIVHVPGLLEYYVCWQDFTSALNADVYVTRFDSAGVQLSTLAIDTSNFYWATPKVAQLFATRRVLVVANVTTNGPGAGVGSIQGRLIDATNVQIVGNAIVAGTIGPINLDVVAAGTSSQHPTESRFIVAWSRLGPSSSAVLEYRVFESDGTPTSAVVPVTTSPNMRAIQPAISRSLGNTHHHGDYWTLAWIQDTNFDQLGSVHARRIRGDGDPAFGAGNFIVDARPTCSRPTVTSRMEDDVLPAVYRPSVVAYEVTLPGSGGSTHRDIYATVITDGEPDPPTNVSLVLEDFDRSLDQHSPQIGGYGNGFVLVYLEESVDPSVPGTRDVFMATGSVVELGSASGIALAERHALLYDAPTGELQPRLAMDWDGQVQPVNTGAAVWTIDYGGGRGQLRGTTLSTLHGFNEFPVGVQYCDANPNSTGSFGGRGSSWLWVEGDQDVLTPHEARAVDLPPNSFGYLLASLDAGNTNLAGGGQGRLCLSGSIGRFLGQIGDSGPGGRIATTVDPTAIPQPNGPAHASVGETWHFQLWHRDTSPSGPTSNFTNACRVTFLP